MKIWALGFVLASFLLFQGCGSSTGGGDGQGGDNGEGDDGGSALCAACEATDAEWKDAGCADRTDPGAQDKPACVELKEKDSECCPSYQAQWDAECKACNDCFAGSPTCMSDCQGAADDCRINCAEDDGICDSCDLALTQCTSACTGNSGKCLAENDCQAKQTACNSLTRNVMACGDSDLPPSCECAAVDGEWTDEGCGQYASCASSCDSYRNYCTKSCRSDAAECLDDCFDSACVSACEAEIAPCDAVCETDHDECIADSACATAQPKCDALMQDDDTCCASAWADWTGKCGGAECSACGDAAFDCDKACTSDFITCFDGCAGGDVDCQLGCNADACHDTCDSDKAACEQDNGCGLGTEECEALQTRVALCQ